MARHVLNKPDQKPSRSKSSSRPQAAKPEKATATGANKAPAKQQKPGAAQSAQPVRFQKIQNDPYSSEIRRATQTAADPDDAPENDPYEALGESASRVHYFQQADRALAEAEGSSYSPERAEQEYSADGDASQADSQDRDSGEQAGELSEDIAQKLAEKLIPLQSEGKVQPEMEPNAQPASRQTKRQSSGPSTKKFKQLQTSPSKQAQSETENLEAPPQKKTAKAKPSQKSQPVETGEQRGPVSQA